MGGFGLPHRKLTMRTPYETSLAIALERDGGPDWWHRFLTPYHAQAIATAPEGLGRQRAILNAENEALRLATRVLQAAVHSGLVNLPPLGEMPGD